MCVCAWGGGEGSRERKEVSFSSSRLPRVLRSLYLPPSLFLFLFSKSRNENAEPGSWPQGRIPGLRSGTRRTGERPGEVLFSRKRKESELLSSSFFFSVVSFFPPPHPSHQTRELQDRADNGDEHPEDGETEGDGTAQGGQVAAVHSVGGRRGGARRRLRFDRCAGLLLREHAAVDAVFACEGRRRVLKGRPETRVGAEKGEEGAAGGTEGERPRK